MRRVIRNYEKNIYLLRTFCCCIIFITKGTLWANQFVIKVYKKSVNTVITNPNGRHFIGGDPEGRFPDFFFVAEESFSTIFAVWWIFEFFNYIFMFTANVRVYKEDATTFSKQAQRKTKSESIQHPHKHSVIGIRAFLQKTRDIYNLFKYLWRFWSFR